MSARERVTAFIAAREGASGLDPEHVAGYNDRVLSMSDLRALLAEPTDQGEDFRSRLVAAAAELESMADISGLAESSRLSGKAEGVRLALSYWGEVPS